MFAPAFAPFANPEAIVNSKLALAFLEAGWEVDIISRNLAVESKYNYGSEWIEPWLPLKDMTYIISYDLGGKVYRFIDMARSSLRMGYFLEGGRWAAYALDKALQLHKKKKYQVILSRSGPDIAHLPAMALAKKKALPWIANWNDASGQKNLPPYGKGADANLGFSYERLLANVARNASWHTFPSDRLRNYICQYLGPWVKEKSSTIPHAAIKTIQNVERKRNIIFSICHAGHISTNRNPKTFLKGLADFAKREDLQDSFKLIIIGLDDVGVCELAVQYGLEANLQIIGPLSYSATLNNLAKSDVLLVIEATSKESIYLPAKFVDYVQTGRPILAVTPNVSTLNDILLKYGGGIGADCISSEAIARALSVLYRHWKDGTLEKQFGADRLHQLFAPETIIANYKEIFSKICA